MHRALAVIAVLSGLPLAGQPAAGFWVIGQFHTPLKYEAVLQRLDGYYDEQIGKHLAAALPPVTADVRFDIWHDMWVVFEPAGEGTTVTMKRAVDPATTLLTKQWMLGFAGRTMGELPLTFTEQPGLHKIGSDLCAAGSDVKAALESQPEIRQLPTWEGQALFVSSPPVSSIELSWGRNHGLHHMTVVGENIATVKQLAAKIGASLTKASICAAYSEAADLDAEIRGKAAGQADELGASASTKVYVGQIDPKVMEAQMRTDPELQKRVAGAAGYYGVRYRVDKPYSKVTVKWAELVNYDRAARKFASERAVGQGVAALPHPGAPGANLMLRTKLALLSPGAYRIRLETESAGGPAALDERDFWFDGKTFEEM